MKIARTILIFALIISICFIAGCEKSKIDKNEIDDERSPLLYKIISTKREFDLSEDVKLIVAYGWIGYSEDNDSLVLEDGDEVSYYIENVYMDEYGKTHAYNTINIKSIDDLNTLKYKISLTNEGYKFSYSEELLIPHSLFSNNEGNIRITILGKGPSYTYGAVDVIEYRIIDNKIIIDEITFSKSASDSKKNYYI